MRDQTLTAPRRRRGAAREPQAGLVLGRYQLIAPIAHGGMAVVWVACQRGAYDFTRLVALKMIRPELAGDASFRRMFLEEARIASRLHHPNVVEVLDLGEEGDVVYQAMPLIEGDSLARLVPIGSSLPRERLPVPIAIRIVVDMLAGLHAAHELRDDDGAPLHLVHRDVSPHNVLVDVEGVSRIADFGIAKAVRKYNEESTGAMKGKLAYLSPEQVAREPVDRRSDIFSTGIVLWEALTGERLFRGDDELDTLRRVARQRIPDVRERDPHLDALVAAVVAHALERDPASRFATAAELGDALETAAAARGLVATVRQVGDYTRALVEDRLVERRGLVAAVAPGEKGQRAADVDDAPPATVARPPLLRHRWAIAAAVSLAGASAFATAATFLRAHAARGDDATAPAHSAPASPASAEAAPETEPQVSATAPAAQSAARPSARPGKARKPSSASAPRYDNPYGPNQ